MSIEAPIQINLSEEKPWDKIDDSSLTPQEKNTLQEHFTEKAE
jgi:hypothetical protein